MSRLLPTQVNNSFVGQRLALWLVAIFTLTKLFQATVSVLITKQVLATADAIPIDQYGAAGAQAVTSLFTVLGYQLIVLCLLTLVVLIRYRALIPLMYLVWLVEEAGKMAIFTFIYPIARSVPLPTGFVVNRILLGVLVIGFVLSLVKRSAAREAVLPE